MKSQMCISYVHKGTDKSLHKRDHRSMAIITADKKRQVSKSYISSKFRVIISFCLHINQSRMLKAKSCYIIAYIYIYIHRFMHTHTHTHTYIYIYI